MERAKEKEQPMYIGVDMVKAARWERICEKFPSRLEKMFTEEERAHCESKGKNKAYSYAALWKALGIGILGSGFGDAYLSWTKWGAPVLHLQGNFEKRAEKLGITDMSVSISHEDGMSIAVVVMEAKS